MVLGQGGTINFTPLADTPNELTPQYSSYDAGTAIQLATLASTALGGGAQDTIVSVTM